MSNFTSGEIYFIISATGGTFGTITAVDSAARTLTFNGGDAYGHNLAGTGGHIKTISNSGLGACALLRMPNIHYYGKSSRMFMR